MEIVLPEYLFSRKDAKAQRKNNEFQYNNFVCFAALRETFINPISFFDNFNIVFHLKMISKSS